MMHANDGNHPLNAQHRSDSFPSLDENDDDYDGDESYKRSSLEDENERLRQELHQYKRRVVILQGKLNQHSPSKKSHKPSVLLELPRTLKKAATKKFCRSQSLKDHQSFSTDDDQDTIEPNMELEIHQSLGGLYHRGGASHQIQASTSSRSIGSGNHSPLKATSVGSSPITRKTDTTATANSNDDSFSSTDDHLLEEGLEEELERGETRDLLGNRTRVAESSQSQQQRQQEDESFYSILSDRAGWLVGLLVLQSMSSFILARNEALLEQHLVIVQFLTMLVGAGGNAGNQASVRVIRGLAVGTIDSNNVKRFLRREFTMGLCLSLVLGTAGCIRAAIFMVPMLETFAITSSLFMIVIISVGLGALLPLGMLKVGIDPAHSSTTIQVIMDILGVTITVIVSSLVLDSNFQNWLFSFASTAIMDARRD